MKIIFLDVDGVLNSCLWCEEERVRRKASGEREMFLRGMDPVAVARLNEIIALTGADVVISSSWRILNTRIQMCDHLKAAGFKGRVLGMTPRTFQITEGGPWSKRGEEIQRWLDEEGSSRFDVESFIILDDSGDMAHLMDRLILTSDVDGLQAEHVEQAVAMLNAQPERKHYAVDSIKGAR